jgi:hypothetical protein
MWMRKEHKGLIFRCTLLRPLREHLAFPAVKIFLKTASPLSYDLLNVAILFIITIDA